jgi:hypothetical protein
LRKLFAYGSNGFANNGKVKGTPGLDKLICQHVQPSRPNGKIRIAYIGTAAQIFKDPKHRQNIQQSLTALRGNPKFEVHIFDLMVSGTVDGLLTGDYDVVYLDGGYPPHAKRWLMKSGFIERIEEIREKMVILAFSAMAMALGEGSLILATQAKGGSKALYASYTDEEKVGAGIIPFSIVPHVSLGRKDGWKRWIIGRFLLKDAKSIHYIGDGEYALL